MEPAGNPQQQFLHLFAHRHLLKQSMLHKNLDKCLHFLPGSFSSNSLILAYTALCIDNKLDVPEEGLALYNLIHGWVNYFPTLKGRKKVLLGQVMLQESLSP